MNRVQGLLVAVITGLTLICVGLIVAVARSNASGGSGNESNEQLIQSPPSNPVVGNGIVVVEEKSELKEPWEKDPRLPRHLIPLHYDLYLHPNLNTGLFTGRVRIDIEALDVAEYFLVHVKNLTVTDTKLMQGDVVIPLDSAFEYHENEFWVVTPSSPAKAGNYSLHLEFDGSLVIGITGFYKSVYKNKNGDEVPIATSKFQPTDARKAFPCFDEPSFKSTFTVTLVRPSEGYIALSNMPVQNESMNLPSAGLTEAMFEKSVPMVTYLACFIVCDFEFEEKLTSIHGTKFRVYATPAQKHRVAYALDIGANITDYFTDYFTVPYPLPKQDMIAIPDFSSGAMEHWGLITYRETNLLYDPLESSSSNQQRVATVVSHELVHQWFGNLVTLDWWDDLWLNEGFASYMEYKGVANYHPDWEMEAQFLTSDLHNVMNLDATVNSHPIVQEVSHPNQITELFDRISYAKGASVLRMLENFMGAEEFRMGIHNFLEKFKYKNAVTRDLWESLEGVTSKSLPIGRIMDTWTRQMGYPVINVKKMSDNKYKITQERFLKDKNARDTSVSPYSYKWDVPVTWITSNNNNTELRWLNMDEAAIEVMVEAGTQWVKFNVGQFGFYRVNYPEAEWANLARILMEDPNSLGPMDRASLLNDAFSLAEAGLIRYNIPLDMTAYLAQETHLVPWDTIYSSLRAMGSLLRNTASYRHYRKYIVDLVSAHYERLGWEDKGSHTDKINRNNILQLACHYGYRPCNAEAGRIFNKWIADSEYYIKPNIRSMVYKYGMQESNDPDAWEIMFSRYTQEINSQEKAKLLYGLSQVKEPWIIERFLVLAKNESNIRSQDYLTAISYISYNPIGNLLVWKFIQAEWPYLVDRFSINSRYLGRIPKSVTDEFATEFELEQVKGFFAKYPEAGAGTRSRKQALEEIGNNIKWLADHYDDIELWLSQRNQ